MNLGTLRNIGVTGKSKARLYLRAGYLDKVGDGWFESHELITIYCFYLIPTTTA